MQPLKCFILSILFLSSCNKFNWNNPYDPECPKSLFTPSSLEVNMQDNNVRVTWEQKNSNISGFELFRQAESETLIRLASIERNVNAYVDVSVVAGRKYKYSLIAEAGSNPSDTVRKEIQTIFVSTVSTNQVIELGPTFAKIKSNVLNSGGDSIIARGIVWSTSPSPIASNNKTLDGTGVGEYISFIEGLTPSTTYYVRAYSENKRGVSYGQEISFVTQGLPVVFTTDVSNISPGTVSVLGRLVSDGGLPILQKGAVYSTSPNPLIEISKVVLSSTTQSIFSVDIVDLLPSTKYYVRFFAKNSYGVSYGEELPFITESANIILSTSPIVNITGVSAESGGVISDNRGLPILLRGLCWSKTPNPTVINSKSINGTGNSPFTSVIAGLETNTTYYVRAYAENKFGTFYGNEVTFNSAYYLEGNGVVDVEGTRYKTVILGNQEWMAENLKTIRLNNGEMIPNGGIFSNWQNYCRNDISAYVDPEVSSIQGERFGRLYNFYTVIDSRKICPVGWHIPSLSEWNVMFDFIGSIIGSNQKVMSAQQWNQGGVFYGNNLSGLNVLPAGAASYNNAGGLGGSALIWTSTEILPKIMFSRGNSILVTHQSSNASVEQYDNFTGASIRCVKD